MSLRTITPLALLCLMPLTACDDGGASAMLGESCSANTDCLSDYCSEGICASRTFGPLLTPRPLEIEETEAPNTGRMSGPIVGTGEVVNAELRRPVTVELLGETHGLTIRSAYVARPRPDSSLTALVARVTNFGDADVCTSLLDVATLGENKDLLSTDFARLLGWTLVDADSNRELRGCLPPGESGYFDALISDVPYDAIRSFELDLSGANQHATVMPDWTIAPESYSFDPFTRELALTLSDPGLPNTEYHVFTVFLDADDEPLWVDIDTSVFANNGKLAVLSNAIWRGSTDRVEVFVHAYDDE